MSELFDVFFLNFPVDSFSILKYRLSCHFTPLTRIQNAGFEVDDYEFSILPGKGSNIFVNKEKNLYFSPLHQIQLPLEFLEYLQMFPRFVGETVTKMKIRYQEAYQKAGLLFAIQSHI